MDVVDLSRLQFALTAMYHFIFVPLTLGMAPLLFIMESVYVMTRRKIWRDMTKFWGLLFGINFAMGVATGITMEFQFGTNWAYYSHYVGDIFGAPLAIEGLMAFFLEATFIGLFFFGWDKMSRVGHLVVTFFVALGSNLSALWILIANGWMQNPVGSLFNTDTMRMEITSFYDVLFNPVAQSKFVHTVSAGYVTGAIFVLSISAFYMLRGRNLAFAKRSMTVAACFGLASALSVVVLGDESGYVTTEHQQMKLAAIEAEWHTQEPPAAFNLFAIPDSEARTNHLVVKVPYALGLVATRSLDEEVVGITDLVDRTKGFISEGIKAYDALQDLQEDPTDSLARAVFEENRPYLGYAFLLLPYTDEPLSATEQDIENAAWDTVPNVPVLFWSFRIMVGLGFFFIFLFALAFYLASTRKLMNYRWFLRLALFSLPLPWVAAELGWIVAEYGRQPWIIEGVLPTFLAVSHLSVASVWLTIIGFTLLYSALLVVALWLMVKYIRLGPEGYFKRQLTVNRPQYAFQPSE